MAIDLALDRFDNAMRAMADRDRRIASFNDRQWFEEPRGERDGNGGLVCRDVLVADRCRTRIRSAATFHATLAYDNAGEASKALRPASLSIASINASGLDVRPITEPEIYDRIRV